MTTEGEQLLGLLFGAKDRYRTARATIREWRDEKTADEVRRRFSETELHREVFGPPSPQASEHSPHKREAFERIWKVWHERPNRWRQEAVLPDDSGIEYRVI